MRQRADQRQQAPRLDRLGHVLDGATLERRDRGAHRAVTGDEHGLGLGTRLVQHLDERDAVATRQLQIGEHQVERVGAEALERRLRRQRDRRLVALEVQQLLERLGQALVVINDQDLRGHFSSLRGGLVKQGICQFASRALRRRKGARMHTLLVGGDGRRVASVYTTCTRRVRTSERASKRSGTCAAPFHEQ